MAVFECSVQGSQCLRHARQPSSHIVQIWCSANIYEHQRLPALSYQVRVLDKLTARDISPPKNPTSHKKKGEIQGQLSCYSYVRNHPCYKIKMSLQCHSRESFPLINVNRILQYALLNPHIPVHEVSRLTKAALLNLQFSSITTPPDPHCR